MPCTIKIRVVEARDLPVMDRASKLADTYVSITFASFEAKSSVSRKNLNPQWDEEFRFDVADDSVLQSQPIEFKLMDHDVYTSDATIGIVYVDLNCLLMRDSHVIQGWFPVYDTLLGVRCELSLVIRLLYFGDVNPFHESSAGVQFFGLSTLDPTLYTMEKMLGFVEELVVHADPEYSWSDNFRTSRKSNEYRQLLLYKLSSQVGTLVGKKAMELGGNAVLAYKQFFDVEGDSGLVARACGTACYITPVGRTDASTGDLEPSAHGNDDEGNEMEQDGRATKEEVLDAVASPRFPTRRFRKPLRAPEGFDISVHDEVQLITLKVFSPATRIRLGGIVSARSVKYLGKMATKLADQETRDSWWLELREEIRAHAQSLQCPFVIGYTESCTIHDDVCVISATGTAAVLKNWPRERQRKEPSQSYDAGDETPSASPAIPATPELAASISRKSPSAMQLMGAMDSLTQRPRARRSRVGASPCMLCHIPYSRSLAPFSNMRMVRCGICGNKWVPEMLIASVEPPAGLAMMGRGTFIQARVCRQRRKGTGDANATIVSDALPFLEYELYRQLIVKMKVLGVNAVFSFDSQIQIGGSLIVGVITGTGLYLPALPPPPTLRIERNIDVKDDEDRRLVKLQNQIEDLSTYNKEKLHRDRVSVVQPEYEYYGSRNLRFMQTSSASTLVDEDQKGFKRFLLPTNHTRQTQRRLRRRQLTTQGSSRDVKLSSSSENVLHEQNPPSVAGSVDGAATGADELIRQVSSSSESSSDSEEEAFADGFSDSRDTFVLEIDDETDEDLMSVLLEQELPEGIVMCNTDRFPGDFKPGANIHLIVSMKRVEWDEDRMRDTRLNELLSVVFKDLFASLLFKIRSYAPCAICGLKTRLSVASETMIEVVLIGMALLENVESPLESMLAEAALSLELEGVQSDSENAKDQRDRAQRYELELANKNRLFVNTPLNPAKYMRPSPENEGARGASSYGREWIEITPLSYIPGARVTRYLGRVTLHFIKESWTVRESGGLGAFYHLFLHEAIAIVRAHVRALGGNAILTFRLVPIESSQLYRNQVYNMISITGDAVMIERESDLDLESWAQNFSTMSAPDHVMFDQSTVESLGGSVV
ncbi:hypothetical protein Poli38472_010538 [Pythium oligandrum]|uniref:C2 domain-containing protein n=1 Tax=Pythium oligandrum TaxID=41045 RepID=A0A8K1C373_PYTOL|nr:hypothetical protein Poli38472_010538 [Pythium oligandrum]|eukprot:TMW55656.1 hypothetical protein Poli38472_010538 [Pythium oligandrum]